MKTEYRFIEPTDVLYLRGNRLFGESGSHGEALMPPWPSLVAGALRSWMLVHHGVSLLLPTTLADDAPAVLRDCLGTPAEPGVFQVSSFTLAQRHDNGSVEPLLALPADRVGHPDGDDVIIRTLQARSLHPALASSAPLDQVPLLAVKAPAKAESGLWLNRQGITRYLAGEPLIATKDVLRQKKLWANDSRLGIALQEKARTAADGRIYTAETVALKGDVGFLVGVNGAGDYLPAQGLIRLGGDGRGATVSTVSPQWPEPPWAQIAKDRRFRLVLTTPGLFPHGWLPPGVSPDTRVWEGPGFSAKLASAAVSRCQVISGWDLVKRHPKPAQRVAPVGSVYWFEDFQGDVQALQRLMTQGLWDPLPAVEDAGSRRAEGFNHFLLAAWPR